MKRIRKGSTVTLAQDAPGIENTKGREVKVISHDHSGRDAEAMKVPEDFQGGLYTVELIDEGRHKGLKLHVFGETLGIEPEPAEEKKA